MDELRRIMPALNDEGIERVIQLSRDMNSAFYGRVFCLAEGEPATNNPQGKALTLEAFEEAISKIEVLKPKPSDNCVMIQFPLMDWRVRFPKFKALFTSEYDYLYGEISILGIPIQITPAVSYMEVRFIMEDGSIKTMSLNGVC